MKVSLSAEALVDAEQAADWYIDLDAWEAAQSLQTEISQALARIAKLATRQPSTSVCGS